MRIRLLRMCLLAGFFLAGALDPAAAAKSAKVVTRLQQAGKAGASYQDVSSALRTAGFIKARTKGSHEQWQHPSGAAQTVSPHAGKVPGYQVTQVLGQILSERVKRND